MKKLIPALTPLAILLVPFLAFYAIFWGLAAAGGEHQEREDKAAAACQTIGTQQVAQTQQPATLAMPAGTTLKQKVAQTFVVGFDASVPKSVITHVVQTWHIGGIYFTSADHAAAEGFDKKFFDSLNAVGGGIPLTIASDEEGGQVMNYDYPFSYPSAKAMGAMSNEQVTEIGGKVGQELSSNGVTMVLGPVLDLDSGQTADQGDIIGGHERSFSADPQIVTERATAFIKGITPNGVRVVLKHAPGLGLAGIGNGGNNTDARPVSSPDITDLREKDLPPYQAIIKEVPNVSVMLSNETITGLDPILPASLSPAAVQLMRNSYGFSGVLTTDDLGVPSVTGGGRSLPQAVSMSVKAGVNMPLFGNIGTTEGEADAMMDSIINSVIADNPEATIDANVQRVLALKTGQAPAQPTATVNPVAAAANCCPAAGTTSSNGGSSANLAAGVSPDDNNGTRAYKFFIDHGLSHARAAGIVGNLQYESGVGPMRLQGSKLNDVTTADVMISSGKVSQRGVGWGIAQFTPSDKYILTYLSQGKTTADIDTLAVQLDYLWNVLQGDESAAMEAYMSPDTENDPEAAAMSFLKNYERPQASAQQGESAESRKAIARAYFQWGTKGTALPQEILAGVVSGDAANPGNVVSTVANPAAAAPASSAPVATGGHQTVIALDPGHGAEMIPYVDPVSGLKDRETNNQPEGDDVLGVANNVKAALEAAGYKVVMIRSESGQAINKLDRVKVAREAHADLVVSIHTGPGGDSVSQVWPQRVNSYREYTDENGHTSKVTVTNEAVANLSQQYAQVVARARTAAESTTPTADAGYTVTTDDDLSAETGSFGPERTDVFSKGNISLLQLWGQDIPWIYNELSQDGPKVGKSIEDGYTTPDRLAKYTEGLINGIEAAIPATSGSAPTVVPAVATVQPNSCAVNPNVTAIAANAAFTAATNCADAANTLRQRVVCFAQGELATWNTGALHASDGYFKYSQDRVENWCADFSSWVYNQAGFPIGQPNWNVPAVSDIWNIGSRGDRFTFMAAGGYTPVPGDMIIHKENGSSHVNIVVAVNGNQMTIIGGNQGQGPFPGGSTVTTYTVDGFSGVDDITGYVAPKQ